MLLESAMGAGVAEGDETKKHLGGRRALDEATGNSFSSADAGADSMGDVKWDEFDI